MIHPENEQKEPQPPQETEKPVQFQPEKSPTEIRNERMSQINIEEIQKVSQEKDARELARVKSELEQLTNDENISPYQLSKEQIIEKCRNSIITPEKPSLKETIKWAIKTKFGQKYDSIEGALLYDKFARYYFAREKIAKDIVLSFLENILAHPNDALICERAAGTGIITEALINAGYNVRASDLSEAQLAILSQRIPNVKVVQEDINGPMQGVENESVDGIVEVAADRYMTTGGQENYVKEAQRVLKKDGVLLWPVFPGEFVLKLKYGLQWRAGKRQISKLVKDNGFEIVSNKLYIHGLNASKIYRLCIAKKL